VVLQEIIDEHSIRLIIPISFYVLEHFQEDHWIIVVEKMDKNQNPKFLNKQIQSNGVRFGFPSMEYKLKCGFRVHENPHAGS